MREFPLLPKSVNQLRCGRAFLMNPLEGWTREMTVPYDEPPGLWSQQATPSHGAHSRLVFSPPPPQDECGHILGS